MPVGLWRWCRCDPIIRGAVVLLVLATIGSPAAHAHEVRIVGPLRLTIGWGDEPAFSGLKNSVEVDVAEASGAPVADFEGSLSVDVAFGDQRFAGPLTRVRSQPGKFRAWLVPTRPGTYAFHITGTITGQTIDVTSACSDKTFACVVDLAEIQFPAKDPSTGQLAERVDRALPRADRAGEVASTARLLAIAAVVAAAGAVLMTIRSRRRSA